MKYIGFDRIIDTVIERLGEIREVYIVGSFRKASTARSSI
jgi:hypothetical protein